MNDNYEWVNHWAANVLYFVEKKTGEVQQTIEIVPLTISDAVYNWDYRKFTNLVLLKKLIESRYEPN